MDIYTVPEAAKLMGLSRVRVWQFIRDGRLKATKVVALRKYKLYVIAACDLDDFRKTPRRSGPSGPRRAKLAQQRSGKYLCGCGHWLSSHVMRRTELFGDARVCLERVLGQACNCTMYPSSALGSHEDPSEFRDRIAQPKFLPRQLEDGGIPF